MNELKGAKKGKPVTTDPEKDDELVRVVKLLTKKFTWVSYVKLICGLVAILMIVLVIIKLANPDLLPEVKFEVVLLALAIALLLPYISNIEALGVKVSVKEQVQEL